MSNDSTAIKQEGTGKYFVPSLFISRFTISPPSTLLSLLLIEIGLTFGLQVGIVGQISAATYFVALIASIIVGALSVRFNHKRLLLAGLLIQALSAITCALSNGFNHLLIFYSLNGLGSALIAPMTMSLSASHLQKENRASAIGWIIMSIPASTIISSLAINYLADLGSWRLPFLILILPINVLSLILATKGIPSQHSQSPHSEENNIIRGFTEIVTSKSAIACLIGTVLSAACNSGFLVYRAAFFRETYLVSIDFASLMFIGASLCMAFGSWIAGRLMKRVKSRKLWALSMILAGSSIIFAFIIPNLWISLIFSLMISFQVGIAFATANNLTLDQVPNFRGTIMSLFTAAINMGQTFGASFGGMILLRFTYGSLGLVLGTLGFLSAVVIYIWAYENN